MSTTEPIYIIYKITCIITGKSYIGLTSCGLKYRWVKHTSDAKNGSEYYFHRAIRKHNKENFTHEILFETTDQNIINEKEIEYIAEYDTYHNGYNSTIGGQSGGSGEDAIWYGRHHSKETKLKMQISANRGRDNPSYKGDFITPWGKFITSIEASNAINNLLHKDTIRKWCKNPYKLISKVSITMSKFLQDLPESPLGKTKKELGFGFIPI